MLLAIDIGNTHVVIGCMEGDETKKLFRMVTDISRTSDEYSAYFQNILEINGISCKSFDGAVISSVVPPLTDVMKSTVKTLTGLDALVIGAGVKTGMNILIENPAVLGSDLVAGGVAAMCYYDLPAIVFDLGTATTISVISDKGAYIGGVIAPGVTISMNALTNNTSLLQKVQLEAPPKYIGWNTATCMQSGAIYGTAAMMDGMIERIEEEIGQKATVVATGGLADKIVPYCKHKIICDENLLLRGLVKIYEKNRKTKD